MQMFLEEGNTKGLINHLHISINKFLAFPKSKFEMRERENSRQALLSWDGRVSEGCGKGIQGDGALDSPPGPLA